MEIHKLLKTALFNISLWKKHADNSIYSINGADCANYAKKSAHKNCRAVYATLTISQSHISRPDLNEKISSIIIINNKHTIYISNTIMDRENI